MLAADAVRIAAIGSLVVALAIDRLVVRADRDRRVRRGDGASSSSTSPRSAPSARSCRPRNCRTRRRRAGALCDGDARRRRCRRRALRARPRAAVRRRRASRMRSRSCRSSRCARRFRRRASATRLDARADRRGIPLALGAPVPANVRDHLRGANFIVPGRSFSSFVVARASGTACRAAGSARCIALFGAAALLGSFVAPRVNRAAVDAHIVVAELWLNVAIVAFVVVPNVYVLLAAIVTVSFLIPAGNAAIIGYRTAVTPDRLIGRVRASLAASRSRAAARPTRRRLPARRVLAALTVLVFQPSRRSLALWGTLSPSIRKAPSLSELAAPT